MRSFFLITPFKSDPEFDSKRSAFYYLAGQYELTFLIADEELVKSGQYVSKCLEMISKSDFVIADLSYERPSCYYELGYLQAMNKIVYLIARQNTIIHQLLTPEKIIFYTDFTHYKEVIIQILRKEAFNKNLQLPLHEGYLPVF